MHEVQAKTLLGLAEKLIALGRQGIKDYRGRTASIARAADPEAAAEAKAERDAAITAGRCDRFTSGCTRGRKKRGGGRRSS